MILVDNMATYLEEQLQIKKMSIYRLADEIGMSYSQTYDIVKEGISAGTRLGNIEKIARVLDVPVFEVISKQKRKN
jgi:DNA-binding Xre family transcriptional regulator